METWNIHIIIVSIKKYQENLQLYRNILVNQCQQHLSHSIYYYLLLFVNLFTTHHQTRACCYWWHFFFFFATFNQAVVYGYCNHTFLITGKGPYMCVPG